MSNIPKIDIFSGINDVPVEATLTEGCNGSALVSRVNKLVSRNNHRVEAWGDCTVNVEWFVDTVNGLDTNNGLTQATAFLTLQRALEVVTEKSIDSCYSTYIKIRGTVTGILDFTHIYSWYNNQGWSGGLTLAKWDSETLPWIYQAPAWIDNSDFTYKGTWFSNVDNGLVVSIEDCRIEIRSVFSIINFSLYTSNVRFVATGLFPTANLIITNAKEAVLGGCTFDTTASSLHIQVDNSNIGAFSPFIWVRTNGIILELMNWSRLALGFERLHTLFATSTIEIRCDTTSIITTLQEDSFKLDGLNLGSVDGDIIYGRTKNHFSFSINVPNPGNGRYMLGVPNKPCYLKSMAVSAASGSGTLRPYLGGNALLTATPRTFNGVDNVFFFENINANIPFARANSAVMEITGASSIVNLYIQANFVDRL